MAWSRLPREGPAWEGGEPAEEKGELIISDPWGVSKERSPTSSAPGSR